VTREAGSRPGGNRGVSAFASALLHNGAFDPAQEDKESRYDKPEADGHHAYEEDTHRDEHCDRHDHQSVVTPRLFRRHVLAVHTEDVHAQGGQCH
jgi:hypothetical protein